MNRRRFLQHVAFASVAAEGLAVHIASAATSQSFDRRRLRFALTFSNPRARTLENQRFWCYLPANESPRQRLRDVQISMPHRLHEDSLGHQILELSFDSFPPLAQRVVHLQTDVEVAASEPLALPSPEVWLKAERFIESDDARIRDLASELQRATPLATARAIFEWVRDNIAYEGYLVDDLGALQALLGRRGDCTEYADLLVALARANGIPARMIGGYFADHDLAPPPQDYHNWAELYLDGRWRVADAQKGHWLDAEPDYVTFRIYRDAATNEVGLAHRYRMLGELELSA